MRKSLTEWCERVRRLKPDSVNDNVRVIVDGQEDIGIITREDLAEVLYGVEPQPVLPSGEADLSESTWGVKVTIPVYGQVYVVIAEQVRNILEKWQRKKVTVFQVEELYQIEVQ